MVTGQNIIELSSLTSDVEYIGWKSRSGVIRYIRGLLYIVIDGEYENKEGLGVMTKLWLLA